MAKANNAMEFDFAPDKAGDKKQKEVNLMDPSTYLKPEYAKKAAEAASDEAGAKTNELDRLVAESKDPSLAVARLNNELIEGYQQIYGAKSDYQLQKIGSSPDTKSWQKEAIKRVLHSRNKRMNTPEEEEELG